jgi:hypothetical protein
MWVRALNRLTFTRLQTVYQDVYSKHALTSVFTDIFNFSLTQSVIPTCFKQTNIVLVHKNAKVTCLNYNHPVALTFVAMKCFERLVMAHINTIIPKTLDPLQFAHHPNRSTDNAISCIPHCPFRPGQKEYLLENAVH